MMIGQWITVGGGGNHPKMGVSMWKDKKDMNQMKFGELTDKGAKLVFEANLGVCERRNQKYDHC